MKNKNWLVTPGKQVLKRIGPKQGYRKDLAVVVAAMGGKDGAVLLLIAGALEWCPSDEVALI